MAYNKRGLGTSPAIGVSKSRERCNSLSPPLTVQVDHGSHFNLDW